MSEIIFMSDVLTSGYLRESICESWFNVPIPIRRLIETLKVDMDKKDLIFRGITSSHDEMWTMEHVEIPKHGQSCEKTGLLGTEWFSVTYGDPISREQYRFYSISIKWAKCTEYFMIGYEGKFCGFFISNRRYRLVQSHQPIGVRAYVNRTFSQGDTFRLEFDFKLDQLSIYCGEKRLYQTTIVVPKDGIIPTISFKTNERIEVISTSFSVL